MTHSDLPIRKKTTGGWRIVDVVCVSCPHAPILSLYTCARPRGSYLLQRGVRDAVAAEAEVRHGPVELSEERSKGPICGCAVGQDVGDLLTDALQEERLGDVAPHQLTHGCQVCQTDGQLHKKTHKELRKLP